MHSDGEQEEEEDMEPIYQRGETAIGCIKTLVKTMKEKCMNRINCWKRGDLRWVS